jgi:hypothetical protein
VARWCSRCAGQHSSTHTPEACRWAKWWLLGTKS